MSNTNRFEGFHNDNALPIKRGDTLRIPKGTLIEHRGQLVEAKTSYSVKVDHILNGMSFAVGSIYSDGKEHFHLTNREDAYVIEKLYGTNDLPSLRSKMTILDHGNYATLMLPIRNPTICWAGRGGYWSEADINQFCDK